MLQFISVFFSLFLVAFSAGNNRSCRKDCLTILNATSQSWVAGIKNGGKGTNYKITCIAHQASSKMEVNHLWVGNDYLEAKAMKSPDKPLEGFLAGDTIIITASRFISGQPKEDQGERTMNQPVPYKYKGEGLIGYKCGKKMKYAPVAKFQVLEKMNMP